jgi:hypothetical protein
MYRITDSQIDFILEDLSARGLSMESLQQDILDHVCCIIEQELKEPDGFEQFYRETIVRFYKRELSEIEEETILLLTFKNYYTMKKVMISSGAASAFLLIAGSFLKLFQLPGAAPLLVLGVAVMCFLFLPLLLVLKMKEKPARQDKLILVTGVVIGILYCLSTIFRVMHWPGAVVMTVLTIALSFFVLIPAYFFTGIRRPETRINTIVSTIILVAATTMQFTLLSLKALRSSDGGNVRVESPMAMPQHP